MVDRVDQELGKLISFLKDNRAWENTLLIVLSDNGATAEQGINGGVELDKISVADINVMGTRSGHDGGTSGSIVATIQNTPLRKYKTTLWDGGMRTSMIVHWPNRIAPEVTRRYLREPIAVFDLAPTCYEAAEIDYPKNIGDRELRPMDGISFLSLLKGKKISRRNLCYAYKDYRVVRNEKWKLLGLFNTKDPQKAGKEAWQLFDLAKDQREIVDVADKHPEVVRELAQLWQSWDDDVGVTAGYRNYWDNVDNPLKFTVTVDFDGYSLKVDYKGRPYGNKMSGSLDYDFEGDTGLAEFTARRKHVQQFRNGLPLVFFEDFESGAERWTQTDAKAWQVVEEEGNRVYSQFQKSDYMPPVRSPLNMALVEDLRIGDFVLQARMKQTGKEYGHRDMCIFFGYQDPAHFYYVHIATKADAHANSIFIVNGKPRVSIATERTDGTDWGTGYHDVRIVRDCTTGAIKVYYDDMDKPIMRARDDTFKTGRLGFGSFDDTGNIDDVIVWGRK